MSITKTTLTFAVASFAASLMTSTAMAADTIKIAYIDPLSGPFASTGTNGFREWKFAAEDLVNSKGGILGGRMIEIVPFDNKISAKETLIQLKNAIGQGIQYVAQGQSSGVASALSSAIQKHNKRNPDKRVVHLNYAAVDPALTNKKCNFWHFRFDANADMKMNAITETIKSRPDIKKVYIIGQDYSFGKAVSAAAKRFLKEKRPDIEIVGDELHPIMKVKDFTPYVTKIKAAGADAIITGNWSADMLNLAKAANGIGLDASFFTYYAAGAGITAAIGPAGKGRIFNVSEGHANPTVTKVWDDYNARFKAKHPKKDITMARIPYTLRMFAKAVTEADSAKPIDVANALEGMEITTMAGDRIKMRKDDHQMQMPIQVSVHTDERIKFDYDGSGWGLLTATSTPAESNTLPTTCKMKRPKS